MAAMLRQFCLKSSTLKSIIKKNSCTQSKGLASMADEQALLKFIHSPGIY